MKKKMIIAGGSGFIGKIVQSHFEQKGYEIIIISRSQPDFKGHYEWISWDGSTIGSWRHALENAEVLINLSGKSVNCRYTPSNKKLLIDSRIHSTRVLGQAIQSLKHPPRIWFNSSSATLHSNAGKPVGEDGPQAEGFSPDLVRMWEKALFECETPFTRKVALRMGLVLDSTGSTMTVFKRLVKLGLGGKMGTGNQHIAWIHKTDLLNIIEAVISDQNLFGPINTIAPNPSPNKLFMKALRSNLHVPFGIPAMEWMVRIGASVIGTSPELVLWDRQVVPTRLINAGFRFKFPTIDVALRDLLQNEQ